MPKKLRVGFVGSGGTANNHANHLAKRSDVKIEAFCDVLYPLAQKAAEQFSARAFRSAGQMFDAVELDAAFFCLPPFAHGDEFLAIERGIPFFIEKPVNLKLDQAQQIARAVARKRLITSVGYMNRYRKSAQTVRKMLSDDPAILVLGGWIGGTPRPAPGPGIWSWWIQKKKSGGQFLEQVTHTVDLARFLCGEAVSVQAFAARGMNKGAPKNCDIEDASVVNIKFKSGAVANLWASCSANGGGGGVSLNVYANQMTALFTGWGHSVRIMRPGKEPVEIEGEGEIFTIEDEAFVKAVLRNDPSLIQSPYADGVKTLAISVAANESIKTGKPVAL